MKPFIDIFKILFIYKVQTNDFQYFLLLFSILISNLTIHFFSKILAYHTRNNFYFYNLAYNNNNGKISIILIIWLQKSKLYSSLSGIINCILFVRIWIGDIIGIIIHNSLAYHHLCAVCSRHVVICHGYYHRSWRSSCLLGSI